MQKHPQGFFVRHFGLRGVALFEGAKGLLAILATIWILRLRHKDMSDVADSIMGMLHRVLHINPDRHVFQRLQHYIEGLTPNGLSLIAAIILIYAMVRFVEGAGLWMEKQWAEWFALISGGLYIPFEIYELTHRATAFKWGVLSVNVLIVLYMAWLLRDSHKRRHPSPQPASSAARS
jgi:uncharacterized membrane protein (DUF2068 family)